MSNTSAAKDMSMLQASIDSMKMVGDSIGRQYYREVSEGNFRSTYGLTKEDTVKIMEANITEYNIDSLYEVAPLMQKQKVISSAASRAENLSSDINFKSYTMGSHDYSMRKHEIEWHKRSLFHFPACCSSSLVPHWAELSVKEDSVCRSSFR